MGFVGGERGNGGTGRMDEGKMERLTEGIRGRESTQFVIPLYNATSSSECA